MEKKIFFDSARSNVLDFFSIEFPAMKLEQVDAFMSMFYKLVNYEEESHKIRPAILISSHINSVVRNIPNCKKIIFYEDEDMSNFKARIKSLMCFCSSDWYIYINFGEENIEYGIIKSLTSIKEKSLLQHLQNKSTLEAIAKRSHLVILNVLGGGICRLSGARGNKCAVCFNLNSQSEYNWDTEIDEFVEACVSKIKTTQKKLSDIKNLITNIFHRVLRDLHGTICIVIDKEYKDKNGFLSDGTWLKEPIEFGKLFLRSSKFDESVLRSYADVLTTMLDFDGITVIDNAGRIRAYNVFIESNPDKKKKIVGGARRRAAYTILQNKSKKIIGVYFQSQDGDNFYKERSDLKKKKKVKIINGEVIGENSDMLPLEIIAKLQQQKKKEEEQGKVEKEKLEKALEKERTEKEKLAKEIAEKERIEKERIEKEKLEKESPASNPEEQTPDTQVENTTNNSNE
ncbi:MAG: hypothetical protein IJW59_01105 [Clostridia bacterium]|nr:hypothetical protein [Clostridia bacterium]